MGYAAHLGYIVGTTGRWGTITGNVTDQEDLVAYINNATNSLDAKQSVRVTTENNIPTLSGLLVVDGITLLEGDRVLVKDQDAFEENGIYVASASAWTRATDFDSWDEVVGAFTFVEEGLEFGDTAWVCTVDRGGTIDVSAILFSQFSILGDTTAQHIGFDVKADEAISIGNVVYASSALGPSEKIGVSKYIANNTIEPRRIVGIAAENIAQNSFGRVYSFGTIKKINTSLYAPGTILYASDTTPGAFTNVPPTAPNQDVAIAFVIHQGSNGVIMVRAFELGFTLGEIHDVYVNGVSNGSYLKWNSSTARWETENVDDTPVDGATLVPVSSNWAFDHAALTTAHGISSFGATLVDDADAATARTTLGLGSLATQNANNVSITGGTIDGVPLGNTTPAAGTFTEISTVDASTYSGTMETTTLTADRTYTLPDATGNMAVLVTITQAEYDALGAPNPNILYVITG